MVIETGKSKNHMFKTNKPKSNIVNRFWRLNHLYKIIDKRWQSITFKLNEAQLSIYRLEKEHNKIIILKARQLWISTYKLISWLDKSLFYHNRTIIITAHKQEKQQELFQKVKYAFAELPQTIKLKDWRIWKKPTPRYDSVNELYFQKLNSRIKVSLDSRSWTPTDLHITELAFKPDAKKMMTGTLPSIPKWSPITIETTANGASGYFYELWKKFENTDKWFHCLFIPRYTDKDYTINTKEKIVLPEGLDHLNKLNLTNWQKSRYIDKYNELWRECFQEYPSTPDEAFLTTGDTVFSLQIVKSLPIIWYKEDYKYAWLRIYKQPDEETMYIYGVDTAMWWIYWDYSTISVRDTDLNLCAFYYWHIPPDTLAEVIDHLWEMWYMCENIWIEVNNTWIATITRAKEYVWYQYIYAETTIDKISNRRTRKVWWNTNLKTRPKMISDYEEAIRKWLITQIDERLRSEMYSFIYNEKKRPEAQKWSHDDAIICDCICYQMSMQYTTWFIG